MGTRASAIAVAESKMTYSLNSRLPNSAWYELKYIDVKSDTGGSVHLFVLAVSRVLSAHAIHGSYVHIHSSIGTITLDDDIMTFSDERMTEIFKKAGFVTTPSGRRLQGITELLGFFNDIPEFENWCGALPAERLPSSISPCRTLPILHLTLTPPPFPSSQEH